MERSTLTSSQKKGFTLIELVIFSAIASVTMITFISILIMVLRIQVRQQAVSEVTTQSQFLLQTIQRYVQESSDIEWAAPLAINGTTTQVLLRMATDTADNVHIYRDFDGGVYICQPYGSCTAQRLTSNRVNVTDFYFTRLDHASSSKVAGVTFTMAYNTSNTSQLFSQFLDFSVARVSASTFTSNVLPSGGSLGLGASGYAWQHINNVIYFNGSNVGINVPPGSAQTERLRVGGGDIYIDNSDGGNRGLIINVGGGTCWKWRPNAANGALTTSTVACP